MLSVHHCSTDGHNFFIVSIFKLKYFKIMYSTHNVRILSHPDNNFNVGPLLELRLEFRTWELNGIILSVADPRGTSLSLELVNGAVSNIVCLFQSLWVFVFIRVNGYNLVM